MPINPLYTHQLIQAYEQVSPPTGFLQTRYFSDEIVYNSYDIIAEYRKRSKKPAPFILDRHNGIPVNRGSYDINTFVPPMINIFRPLSSDDLEMKGFGEAMYAQLTPEQRQDALLLDDMRELDQMITRTEEIECADVMLHNSVTVKGYADDLTTYEEKTIKFYDEENNPAVLSVSPDWDANGADILGTLQAAVEMKVQNGQRPDDLLCAPNVTRMIINDKEIREVLDNRRITLGEIDPRIVGMGVTLVGVLNVLGYDINIMTYIETYDNDGTDTRYIPDNFAVLATVGAGVRTYGRISQIEQNSDGTIRYYANKRVPHYTYDVDGGIRKIALKSRPLPMPKEKNPFVVMQVS